MLSMGMWCAYTKLDIIYNVHIQTRKNLSFHTTSWAHVFLLTNCQQSTQYIVHHFSLSLTCSEEVFTSTPAAMPEEKNKPIIYSMVIPASSLQEKPKVFDVRVNYETVDHLKTEEVRHVLELCHMQWRESPLEWNLFQESLECGHLCAGARL